MASLYEGTLEHLTKIIAYIGSPGYKGEEPSAISTLIKRNGSHQNQKPKLRVLHSLNEADASRNTLINNGTCHIKNFELQSQKLQWAGISFGNEVTALIQKSLLELATREKTSQIRFWGVVRGRLHSYYVIQGLKDPYLSSDPAPPDSEKNGEGVNYYSFWVSTDIRAGAWVELPDIQLHHLVVARQIKKLLTGDLEESVESYPEFRGKQKHYLKAQICRITHSLELVPKGVYKVHDENPKLIEYEEEVKLPEFSQLSTQQGWAHKNQMILNLGRCSHYVDPKLSEEQIEARMSELAEKDPEIERLRAITEDRVPEELGLGVESPWVVKLCGDTQVFTREDSSLVYAVAVARNIYWPGWTTIGYKNGYSNIYIGDGLKAVQNTLSVYQNEDLAQEAEQIEQYPEPNPKQESKEEALPAEPLPDDQ